MQDAVYVQSHGAVTSITTATASPITVIGSNSSASIGGNHIQSSTVNGAVTSITTATASPITVIGNNSSALIGYIHIF